MKCHLLISGFKHEVLWADIGGKRIWESTENMLHIDRYKIYIPCFQALHQGRTKIN